MAIDKPAELVAPRVRRREKLFGLLNNPLIWEASRIGLDFFFKLYRERTAVMRRWGVLDGNPSIIDIGCGIGQYSRVSTGDYLGVDLNERYIRYARKRHHRENVTFLYKDVTELLDGGKQFDVVLMVDFLHHIPDPESLRLLTVASRLAKKYVVSFEPVTEQNNPVGRWIVANDRGNYIHPLDNLHGFFEKAPLTVVDSFPLQLGFIMSRAILAKPDSSA